MGRRARRRRWLIAPLVVLLLLAGAVLYNWTLITHPLLLFARVFEQINDRIQDGPLTYWWGDLVRTIEVKDTTAYVGLGTRLGVVDVADPAKPTLLDTFDLHGIVHGFARRGNTLFCAHGASGMSSFDVSDARHPIRLSHFSLPGYGMHVALMKNGYILFSNERGGWYVVDAKDPANMVPVRRVEGGWVSAARVYGDIAYVLDGYDGVVVYDVSSPENPVRLTSVPIQLPMKIYQPDPPPIWLDVQNGYAYVSNESDGMRVIDVHDPAHAKAVAHLPLDSYSYTVAVRGNRAYMANLELGLVVIDVSNPLDPKVLRSIPSRGNGYDLVFDGDRGYLSDGAQGFMILDFADADDPREIGYYRVAARTRGVALHDDMLVTSDAGDGIRIFDVHDRRRPRLLGSVDTPGLARESSVDGKAIYVVDVLGGFQEIDASDPTAPKIARTFALQEHPWGLYRDGDFLYCAVGNHGFSVFDLRESPPRDVFNCCNQTLRGGDGYAIDTAKAGDLAFCGDVMLGLTVFDVKDPLNAAELGHYKIDRWNLGNLYRRAGATTVIGIFADRRRAYLAGYDRGLEVINLDHPDQPQLQGQLTVPGHSYGVWKQQDDKQACLTTYEGDLYLVDVADPTNPRQQKRIRLPGQLWDVVCEDHTAYVAAGTEGLLVVNLDDETYTSIPVQH